MRVLLPLPDNDPLGGIPLGQLRLMRVLENGPLLASEVATELALSASSLSQMVARLEEAGLIHRACSPEDKRHRTLQLTDEAKCRMAQRRQLRARHAETALAKLPPDQRETLLRAIETLVEEEDGMAPLTAVGEMAQGTPF
jgi:DNA-binding MarR family transcriptional regulator